MSSAKNATTLLLVALTTACASPQLVDIRPLGASATASAPVPARIAEGRAHLLLGDAGLALESFRRALTAEPQSVAALQGLAACYDLMGRSDLSRNYYEQALAIAPRDRETLGAFAASLGTQGLDPEAAAVSSEMAHANSTADIGRPMLVTVMLPPARPVDALPKSARVAQDGFEPHLARMSFGEVALITLPTKLTPTRSAGQVATLAPLVVPTGALPPPTVRLLNAARRQGLAAQARDLLKRQGWRGIVIGDAPRARLTSLILYPAGHQAVARQLGVRFNTILRQQTGAGREIVVLLGRDALSRGPDSRAG